jgi:hypothetical protein
MIVNYSILAQSAKNVAGFLEGKSFVKDVFLDAAFLCKTDSWAHKPFFVVCFLQLGNSAFNTKRDRRN